MQPNSSHVIATVKELANFLKTKYYRKALTDDKERFNQSLKSQVAPVQVTEQGRENNCADFACRCDLEPEQLVYPLENRNLNLFLHFLHFDVVFVHLEVFEVKDFLKKLQDYRKQMTVCDDFHPTRSQ